MLLIYTRAAGPKVNRTITPSRLQKFMQKNDGPKLRRLQRSLMATVIITAATVTVVVDLVAGALATAVTIWEPLAQMILTSYASLVPLPRAIAALAPEAIYRLLQAATLASIAWAGTAVALAEVVVARIPFHHHPGWGAEAAQASIAMSVMAAAIGPT